MILSRMLVVFAGPIHPGGEGEGFKQELSVPALWGSYSVCCLYDDTSCKLADRLANRQKPMPTTLKSLGPRL